VNSLLLSIGLALFFGPGIAVNIGERWKKAPLPKVLLFATLSALILSCALFTVPIIVPIAASVVLLVVDAALILAPRGAKVADNSVNSDVTTARIAGIFFVLAALGLKSFG